MAGGVVAVKDPNDKDILVAKLRIKLRLRYSIEELAEDYITRARVRQQDRGGKSFAVVAASVLPIFPCRAMPLLSLLGSLNLKSFLIAWQSTSDKWIKARMGMPKHA